MAGLSTTRRRSACTEVRAMPGESQRRRQTVFRKLVIELGAKLTTNAGEMRVRALLTLLLASLSALWACTLPHVSMATNPGVVAWVSNKDSDGKVASQTTVPASLSGEVAIAALEFPCSKSLTATKRYVASSGDTFKCHRAAWKPR